MADVTPVCVYPTDPDFTCGDADVNQVYCCSVTGDGTFIHQSDTSPTIVVGQCGFSFPFVNDDAQPMLKSAINGTTSTPFVKIAFQEYCEGEENPTTTSATIITMGNVSQPGNTDRCVTAIKAFQYGWGVVNQGNTCKVTIVDEKGSEFENWVLRLAKNMEAVPKPVQGSYRMKVQFGWYVAGGGDGDICGQPDTRPNVTPADGQNHAFTICSPVMMFMPNWINVHFEGGKFIYELEGADLLQRSQEHLVDSTFGQDDAQLFFTKAVELLGKASTPPFRVQFKCIDALGSVVDMQFAQRPGNVADRKTKAENIDGLGYGPVGAYRCRERPPLVVIKEWVSTHHVWALDLSGKTTADLAGITYNYDSTFKCEDAAGCICDPNLPQYGILTLWGNGIPSCQGDFSDDQINQRMKAVYIVNGSNCSNVISFNPTLKWHFDLGLKAGGVVTPVQGAVVKQAAGAVAANCPITSTRGIARNDKVMDMSMVQKTNAPNVGQAKTNVLQATANIMVHAIEAELRTQGDPSSWLCSPLEGTARCVGIVFINPFFLNPGVEDLNCPIWNFNKDRSTSICNTMLTNKGWFIKGVDHQIKDGTFITTIKVVLLAPGAELNDANFVGPPAPMAFGLGPTSVPTSLGAWPGGGQLPYGGQFAALARYPIGDSGANWGPAGGEIKCPQVWVGGGESCDGLSPDDCEGYT